MRIRLRWATLPLYPFLGAVYPILALAAGNTGEGVRAADLGRPLVISLVVAAAAWLVSRAVVSDPDARSFLAFVVTALFAGYGYLVNALSQWIPGSAVALPVAVLPVIGAVLLVRRVRFSLRSVTTYLNLVLALLVGSTSAGLVWHWYHRPAAITLSDLPGVSVAGIAPRAGARPHVFMIVLDMYTGHRSLAANFAYDNTPFETALVREGFFVPREARANYVHTFLALGAMLNWEYLDGVAARLGAGDPHWADAYPLIEDNRTWRVLRELGYRFVFVPSWFPATHQNRYADLQLPDPATVTREFEVVWMRGTALYPLLERACMVVACSGTVLPYLPESPASLDWKLERIAALAESPRPVFVFAHLIIPHPPYIYEADCRRRTPYWPASDDEPQAEVKRAYIAQLRCVNKKVETMVQGILRRSSRPAIILLQADHGHGRFGSARPPLADASLAQVRERTDVFAAYRLPGAPPGLVYDSISPVNAMRAVMRYYYGLDLPPLPDASFWSSTARPYDFARVP